MQQFCYRFFTAVLTLVVAGCASTYKPQNVPLQRLNSADAYNYRTESTGQPLGVMLAFSGGGTRAAALSYGVMQELQETRVKNAKGKSVPLLTQVSSISSVSGGSFTAAYYGLFGQKLFTHFEKDFLRVGLQDLLIRQMLNPLTWLTRAFQAFDRTEMAVEYYEQQVFDNKTFADMSRNGLPFIEINATDLNGGARFSFTQNVFDMICSDLRQFSVGRAVAASSAVPIVFPTVVIKNHADRCKEVRKPQWLAQFDPQRIKYEQDGRRRGWLIQMSSYLDEQRRPYLHLVDGGIADNLALRALFERIQFLGGVDQALDVMPKMPRRMLIVSVNADVRPKRSIDRSAQKPSLMQTVDAFTDAQMKLYNLETLSFARWQIGEIEQAMAARGHPVQISLVEVNFEGLTSQSSRDFFNALPTTLQLSDSDVNSLIAAGRQVLRADPTFQQFVAASQ